MAIGLLRIFAILCIAFTCGKLVPKLKLPAILGGLIAGIVFGPYLAEVITFDITDALWYKIMIKLFECFAGVMIGREIVFRKIARSGKQIVGITFVQSIGTFLFVSAAFSVVFTIIGMVLLPFVIGTAFGFLASVLMKAAKKNSVRFCLLILFLLMSAVSGLLIDFYIFHSNTWITVPSCEVYQIWHNLILFMK